MSASSQLLSECENQLLHACVPRPDQILAVAVVRLLRADGARWVVQAVGALCLVKSFRLRSYFLQLLDVASGELAYECEVYRHFSLTPLGPLLLSFEDEHSVRALQFVNQSELHSIHDLIGRRSSQAKAASGGGGRAKKKFSLPSSSAIASSLHKMKELSSTDLKLHLSSKRHLSKTTSKQKTLDKSMISGPDNFLYIGGLTISGGDTCKTGDIQMTKEDIATSMMSSMHSSKESTLGVNAFESIQRARAREAYRLNARKSKSFTNLLEATDSGAAGDIPPAEECRHSPQAAVPNFAVPPPPPLPGVGGPGCKQKDPRLSSHLSTSTPDLLEPSGIFADIQAFSKDKLKPPAGRGEDMPADRPPDGINNFMKDYQQHLNPDSSDESFTDGSFSDD